MRMRAWITALLLSACVGAAHAADWQVVLLKPRGCGTCGYLEQILKRGAQLQQAVLEDGRGGQVVAPIQRRNSVELSAQEWTELRALPWFDEAAWRQRAAAGAALVLLKRDGVIASAGDIGDSADLRDAQFPPEITMPDTGSDPMAARRARGPYVSDLFLNSWNLSWFYRVALDPALARAHGNEAWIARSSETLSPPLGSANVVLASTASGAADNEIFNALRIEEIRGVLTQSVGVAPGQLRIFYGSDNPHAANALEVRDRRYGLIRRNVEGSSAFTPDAVRRIFQSIRARPGSRNLLVLIGHGNPDGAGTWGSPMPLAPATLRALHEHGGGDDVLVSGNCYGGIMARATSCGFFGARPDIVATGCQADAAEVAQSRDYLHMFFGSLTPAARAAADTDGNGAVSLAEAHWYASTEGDPRNVTYTSIDALADAHFEAHPDALPASLAVSEILALAGQAPAGEARAVRSLLAGQDPALAIPLADLAGQAMRWAPGSGQPRAVVGQLARRLLFLKGAGPEQRADVAKLQSCENRSVGEFLKP